MAGSMKERSVVSDVQAVFEAWANGQKAPHRCKLNQPRQDLIARRLKVHSRDELITLITYAYSADTSEARFWRGESREGRIYLGLDNLLRAGKLTDRIERAEEWAGGESEEDPSGPAGVQDGNNLGPMGIFVRGPATTVADKVDRVTDRVRKRVRGRVPRRTFKD